MNLDSPVGMHREDNYGWLQQPLNPLSLNKTWLSIFEFSGYIKYYILLLGGLLQEPPRWSPSFVLLIGESILACKQDISGWRAGTLNASARVSATKETVQ